MSSELPPPHAAREATSTPGDGSDFASGGALLDRMLVRAFLEHVPDSVYFKDRASRFIAVSRSKARRHGIDEPTEMIGLTDFDTFSEEHAQWARVDEENIMSTGEPMIGKLQRVVWRDGRETWSEVSKLPLRSPIGEIIGTFGISRDVTAAHRMEVELEKTRREFVDTSRRAGMAEVATGVLHNVGNVLTSLNVSASVLGARLRESKADSLARISALLEEHAGQLGSFLTNDPRGRRIPEFLEGLARHELEDRARALAELKSLQDNLDHIKEIVAMQQAYATLAGVVEPLDPVVLMEDALRMNAGALIRHEVAAVKEFHPVPLVLGERAKILQILVNLIRNAKYAADEGGAADKAMILRIEPGEGFVRLSVIDNGIGIPAENLSRIFEYGFTTRAHGHGFGLHSALNAARELNGALTVFSAGLGQGATFTLSLPVAPSPAPAPAAVSPA